jgi:hypothetical protein
VLTSASWLRGELKTASSHSTVTLLPMSSFEMLRRTTKTTG